MRTRFRVWQPIGIAVLAGLLSTVGRAQPDVVGLYVAPFAGEQPLASQTATVLQLQIWQTLRLAPPNNIHNLSFGRGIVQWAEWKPPTLHSEAMAQLSGTVSQMALWGRVQSLGNGTVVQAYLSVSDRSGVAARNLWRVTVHELGSAKEAIGVGLPATLYEFAPIVLRLDLIPFLKSHIGTSPASVPVYRDRALTQQIGVLGGSFEAVEQGPDYARVRTPEIRQPGWISIPGLSGARSELSDFAGAMIRVYRRDWGGAIELLQRVAGAKTQPVSLRVSSYLLMSAASRLLHEQIGVPDRSLEFVEAAERLNPYLRDTVKYKCMALLADRQRPEALRRLDETVRAAAYLFPKDDPWLGRVKAVVDKRQAGRQ